MLLYGLLGEKLTHSLSPEIHEGIFQSLNMKANYSLFQVEKNNVPKVIESLKTLGISGTNVTIPYKEEIMKYLDFISEEAKNIQAINTIVIKDGKSYGYNTDYYGFGRMLKRAEVHVEDMKIVVLGAGGASKAIIQYLKDNNSREIYLVSRKDKVTILKKYSGIIPISYEELKSVSGDIIINTTPVGMYPIMDATVVGEEVIKNFTVAVDIIYNPLKTKFLFIAESLGLKSVNGLYMLVEQAMKAEEIWQNKIISEVIGEEIHQKLCESFQVRG